jgi:hypothetical protein
MKSEARWSRGLGLRVASISASIAAMLASGVAPAQSVAPSSAPVEWIGYAEASTSAISTWLQEEAEVPARLRAYLNAARPDGNEPVTIEISLWLGSDGRVERLRFAPFADAQANADLEETIVGRHLGAPPRGMLLPMRIAVQAGHAEEAQSTTR